MTAGRLGPRACPRPGPRAGPHEGPRLRRPAGDRGSSIPFVLLCFLVAALLVAAVTTASSAFLAQRDLQADCDGAAAAGASGLDPAAAYDAAGFSGDDALPLATEQAQAAVERYRARLGGDLAAVATVDLDRVTVACARVVRVPFGEIFGVGGGVERSTVSTARSPLRP